MKRIFFAAALIACMCTFDTPVASAYTTSDQRVQKINETTAIYFIDFAFGHEHHDFYIPVLAVRDQEHGSEVKSVGYEVLQNGDERTDRGTTQALVLSKTNAVIENGMYKVPKGFKLPFTLAIVYTTDSEDPETDYAIKVTDLPFYRGNTLDYLRLNPSELQYYRTPEAELNSDNKKSVDFTISIGDIKYTVLD